MNSPNIPNLPTGQIWTVAKNDATWLMKHERIVIVALVLIAGTFLGNKWLNYEGAQKDAKVVALTAQVQQDKQSVAQLALAASQAQATYQTTLDAITKQNASLAAANAQEAASLAQRQTVDKTLALPDVAKRIEVLVPEVGAQGIAATKDGIVLSDAASHSVLNVLESVPVLQDELKNETQIAVNKGKALDTANVVIVDANAQITGLNKELTDQQAETKAIVAADKVKIKKAWRSGFKWGFGLGFAAGAYVMHAL
jgi:hypothetical protein